MTKSKSEMVALMQNSKRDLEIPQSQTTDKLKALCGQKQNTVTDSHTNARSQLK